MRDFGSSYFQTLLASSNRKLNFSVSKFQTVRNVIFNLTLLLLIHPEIMTKDFSILINLYAQNKIELEIILNSFRKLTIDEKRSEFALLRVCIQQSHPTKETMNEAINHMLIFLKVKKIRHFQSI